MGAVALGLFLLACGWRFFSEFKLTSYAAIYHDGHPQYFGSALAAGYLLVLASSLDNAALASGFYSWLSSRLGGALPISGAPTESALLTRLLMVAGWSAILSWLLPILFNSPMTRNVLLSKQLRKDVASEDDLDGLIENSVRSGLAVLVSLPTGKAYVGVPISEKTDDHKSWLAIVPLASGFRNERGILKLTTFYLQMYEALDASDSDLGRSIEDFRVLIPVDKILSVQLFDLDLFERASSESDFSSELDSEQVDEGETDLAQLESTESDFLLAGDLTEVRQKASTVRLSEHERKTLYWSYVWAISLGIALLPLDFWTFGMLASLAAMIWIFIKEDASIFD